MKKFTKLLLLVVIEIIITTIFLGVSDNSDLAMAIIFPPIFAITLYFLIFNIFEIEQKSKKAHLIFALLLASIALFSSSIGFHYASNDINNLFSNNKQIEVLFNRLYFLDEKFSHWLMFAGIFGVILSIILWIYFKKIHKLNNTDPQSNFQTTLFDLFIMVFFGSLIGAILALLAIEANVIKHSLVFLTIFLPFLFFKYKNYIPKKEGKEFIPFMFACISSYIAVSVAYYLIKKGLIGFSYIK